MNSQRSQKPLLVPYKSIGVFCDENPSHIYNAGTNLYMATSCIHSFKVYTLPELKIQLFGPHLDGKVRAIQGENENLYIAIKNKVYKMRHYHILGEFQMQEKVTSILLMGDELAVFDANNTLRIFNKHSKECLREVSFDFQVKGVLHPPTYLNKIIVYGPQNVQLWNISSMKCIYDYQNSLFSTGKQRSLKVVEVSPVLDVLGFGFSDGTIQIHNIKKDQTLLTFYIQNIPTSMSFSKVETPLLAIGDNKGNVTILNLNDRKIYSQINQVFNQSSVSSINFLPNQLSFIAQSGQYNSIKQYVHEEYEENKFGVLRQRKGSEKTIKRIEFSDPLHLFGFSENQLIDFSLINECNTKEFSTKHQSKNKLKKSHIYTEQNSMSQINDFLDFSFSTNRSLDWANLLTCHKESDKPCLWNSEDHTIIKQNVEMYERTFQKDQQQKVNFNQITSVFVTKCGNFGLLGLNAPFCIKINMQSGAFQGIFELQTNNKGCSISSIFVNHYNKHAVISDTDNSLQIFDFYSRELLKKIEFEDKKVKFIRGANFSQHFLVAMTDFSIQTYDLLSFKKGRDFKYHKQTIIDAQYSHNNKYIISSSMDYTIKIYDIASDCILGNYLFNKAVISFSFEPNNGEYFATVFAGSKEINIWHNCIDFNLPSFDQQVELQFISDIKKQYNSEGVRQRFYGLGNHIEEEEIQEEGKKFDVEGEFQNNFNQLITFTIIESGKWVPLINLDEIKERNKLENNEEIQFQMPFFLDFANKDKVREEMKQEFQHKLKEKSKIIKSKQEGLMNEISQDFIMYQIIKKQDGANEFFKFLLDLTPSQVDFELRKILFGKDNQNVSTVLNFFNDLFQNNKDFDLKLVYFNRFLKICQDELLRNQQYEEKLQNIRNQIKKEWQSIKDSQNKICVLSENYLQMPF